MSQTNPAVANHLKQCNARLIEIGTKKDDVFEPSMAILQDLQKGFSKLRVVYDYERNLEYGIVPSSGKPPVALGRDNRFVSVVLDTVWNYFIKGFTNIIPIVNYASDNAELYLMNTYYYARFRVVETLNLMLDNKNSDLLKLVNEDDIKYLTGLGYTYDPWLMPIKQIHLSNVSDNIRKDQEISTRKKMGQYIANMNRMGLKIEALSNDFSLVFFDHSVSYDSDFQSQFSDFFDIDFKELQKGGKQDKLTFLGIISHRAEARVLLADSVPTNIKKVNENLESAAKVAYQTILPAALKFTPAKTIIATIDTIFSLVMGVQQHDFYTYTVSQMAVVEAKLRAILDNEALNDDSKELLTQIKDQFSKQAFPYIRESEEALSPIRINNKEKMMKFINEDNGESFCDWIESERNEEYSEDYENAAGWLANLFRSKEAITNERNKEVEINFPKINARKAIQKNSGQQSDDSKQSRAFFNAIETLSEFKDPADKGIFSNYIEHTNFASYLLKTCSAARVYGDVELIDAVISRIEKVTPVGGELMLKYPEYRDCMLTLAYLYKKPSSADKVDSRMKSARGAVQKFYDNIYRANSEEIKKNKTSLVVERELTALNLLLSFMDQRNFFNSSSQPEKELKFKRLQKKFHSLLDSNGL